MEAVIAAQTRRWAPRSSRMEKLKMDCVTTHLQIASMDPHEAQREEFRAILQALEIIADTSIPTDDERHKQAWKLVEAGIQIGYPTSASDSESANAPDDCADASYRPLDWSVDDEFIEFQEQQAALRAANAAMTAFNERHLARRKLERLRFAPSASIHRVAAHAAEFFRKATTPPTPPSGQCVVLVSGWRLGDDHKSRQPWQVPAWIGPSVLCEKVARELRHDAYLQAALVKAMANPVKDIHVCDINGFTSRCLHDFDAQVAEVLNWPEPDPLGDPYPRAAFRATILAETIADREARLSGALNARNPPSSLLPNLIVAGAQRGSVEQDGASKGHRLLHAPPTAQTTLTVTEAAKLLEKDIPGLTLRLLRSRVSAAAGRGEFTTNGLKGRARRIESIGFDAWRLKQRDRDLDAAEREGC